MCTTFILECGKRTSISEIKTLFAKELKVDSNKIHLVFMPINSPLNDNDLIGYLKPIEGSFIKMSFQELIKLPTTTENQMIKIISPMRFGNINELPFEFEDNPEIRNSNQNAYSIFSDNYQTHIKKDHRFNKVSNKLLENKAKGFEKLFVYNAPEIPSDFIYNLITEYKNNNLEKFTELLNELTNDIEKVIEMNKFPYKK